MLLYIKIQPQSFLGSGEEDFFNYLNKMTIPLQQKAPFEIWWKLEAVSEKKMFKDYAIYTYII